MLIDSHCHINFNTYREDAEEVIQRSLNKDIWLINVGAQYSTSARSIKIAEKYPQGVLAVVGLHPIHLIQDITETATFDYQEYKFTTRQEEFDYQEYKDLALSSKKVVGLGETGLDYYYFDQLEITVRKAKEIQKKVFQGFIKMSQELNLPLVIHVRGSKENPQDAYNDVIEIISNYDFKGVVHCYGGNLEQAKKIIDQGLYLGFTGIITFKKADQLRQIVKEIPLEKILVETDAPFLAPEPYRGKRNEPIYVVEVAKKVAEIKNLSFAQVAEQTFKNTQALFRF